MSLAIARKQIATPDFPINKRSIVLIGDSYINQEIPASAFNTAARGIFRVLNALMGNYFDIVNVAGGSGETLAQIRARFVSDVVSYSPAYFGLIGGANSIVAGVTAEDMYADTKWMIDRGVDSGIIPIILPCQLPGYVWGTTSAADINLKVEQATQYNRMLLDYSMQKSGWLYASDAWVNSLDQAYIESSFSQYVPQYLAAYQMDSAHLNEAGAFRVAKDIYAQIGGLFPRVTVMPMHDNDVTSGCNNPMRKVTGTPHSPGVTGGAGITNAPAEGWYARIVGTGAATVTQEARTDIAGAYWDQYVVTGLASASSLEVLESEGTAFSYNWHSLSDYDLAVGDVIEFHIEQKISGVIGDFNKFSTDIFIADSGGSTVSTLVANINSGGTASPYVAADFDGSVIITSTIRHTIAATSNKWRIRHVASAQNGSAGTTDFTISYGRVGIRKVA